MGIPFYFSYIVKNHATILCKYNKQTLPIDNLFLDCNSIVYDVVHSMNYEELTQPVYQSIIQNVIRKIEEYIQLVLPLELVFIAFDGVAPVAKLQQQRERRYKSWYQTDALRRIHKKTTIDPFNTTSITPGTQFMYELNETIEKHFRMYPGKNKVIVSGSDVYGEGEHKLFSYIRQHVTPDSRNMVYGLDADLIMLSIHHLPTHQNMYLFRETPAFIQSLNTDLEPDCTYYLDIPELAKVITNDMNSGLPEHKNVNRVYDYIFLCFFLGNDFLPHFPALNIRTGGTDKLLAAYKATLGTTSNVLTDGNNIYWKHVRTLVQWLVQEEETYIIDEFVLRDKRERKYMPETTPEEISKKFENIPTMERELEKYIQPNKPFWQKRYYKALFQVDINDERRKQISTHYLEGLEWTLKYYTSGCVDWRWHYPYMYPPLLQDLIHYIPYFDTTFVEEKAPEPVSQMVQLSYVLPKPSLSLLPNELYLTLLEKHPEWYQTDCEFVWAFCKYFWESHILMEDIDIGELEEIVQTMKKNP